jgi:hypothetical protein
MNIGAVTTGSVASAVWTIATRNLTRLGPTMVVVTTTTNTVIAGAGSVDLRPAAGVTRKILIGAKSAGGTGIQVHCWDGTVTFNLGTPGAASGTVAYVGVSDSSVGMRLLNTDGVNAGSYVAHAEDWTI